MTSSNDYGSVCGHHPQAMPDPQHDIPAAFDIQTYVDSVLHKSMQEATKGVSNWLKARRLRSELLEWCLAPGKAVSEVPKKMRQVAAAYLQSAGGQHPGAGHSRIIVFPGHID
ncbi:hypothetical protein CYMTET_17725 [Cymbomonas tetramitiformis]|uniref:Uncharacterized protein n=1 Tax=Cymbomonas tetramitiformis TaxID=36881 RepID=A0AAE0G9D2_9CHLO|nr:hypothetical protein CYMTET_17725 [Cymbomonas tetramitiformis]